MAAHGFGPVDRKLAELFDLHHLAEPAFWATLLTTGRPPELRQDIIDVITRGIKAHEGLRVLLAPEAIEIPAPPLATRTLPSRGSPFWLWRTKGAFPARRDS